MVDARDFYDQYQYLYRTARFGSPAKAAYGFIAGALRKTRGICDTADIVQARLMYLRSAVEKPSVKVSAEVQIDIFEHFLQRASAYERTM